MPDEKVEQSVKQNEIIYLVQGQTGINEDMRYWNVAGFKTKELALDFIAKCEQEAERVLIEINSLKEPSYNYRFLVDEKKIDAHKYDIYFQSDDSEYRYLCLPVKILTEF